jgi:hypothetical protein
MHGHDAGAKEACKEKISEELPGALETAKRRGVHVGIDINFVFQGKRPGGWEDIACEYNGYCGRDSALFAWLVLGGGDKAGSFSIEPLSQPRGFPSDFLIEDDVWHPIIDVDVLPKGYKRDGRDDFGILMGEWGFSYLHADEVLNAAIPVTQRTIEMRLEDYQRWDKRGVPDDWNPLYWDWKHKQYYLDRKISSPEDINAATRFVALEVSYDFSSEFAWFRELLQQLREQHGEVRFVFGFA